MPARPEPRVSVVMSVYNGERFLPPAVESILRQTYHDFEFIVVDDGSSDSTAAILAGYASSDPRLIVLRSPANLGLTPSLNKGMRAARGDYLARQDADDVSAPERLQAQVDFLDAHPEVGLVSTAAAIIDDLGRPLPPVAGFAEPGDNASLQERLLAGNPICHGSVVMRRACYEAAGGYDEDVGPVEDYHLWLRMAELTRLTTLTPALYHYRQHSQAVSHQRRAEQLADMARVLEAALQRRYPSGPPATRLAPVVLHAVRAALAFFALGDTQRARQALDHAAGIDPQLRLLSGQLEELVREHGYRLPWAEGRQWVSAVFDDLLPPSGAHTRMRRRLLSELHMRQVFQAGAASDMAQVSAHLWPGLRYNPAWLANRGVAALAVRAIAAAIRRPKSGR